jgi:membrane fusion protein (multidrug efflux system)
VANFKETQLALMRPGQPVSIKVDALDGHTIKGVVDSIAPGTGAIFADPAQQCDGQFHQDRPARAGAHPHHR